MFLTIHLFIYLSLFFSLISVADCRSPIPSGGRQFAFSWVDFCRKPVIISNAPSFWGLIFEIRSVKITKKNALDMTQGPLAKQILAFSIPLMLTNLLQVLFNMSDIAVLGQFAGDNPLGSVGSTSTLVYLFTGFLIGLGSGVNVLCARYFGARDEKNLSETIHSSILVCLAMGIFVMIVGEAFSGAFLRLLNTKDELMDGAKLYMDIYFLGAPAVALYNYGSGVLSAVGDTRRPLVYLAISGVLNIVLNIIFVVVFGMDVDGVAIASVVSQYLSMVLIFLPLTRGIDICKLSWRKIRPYASKIKSTLALGLPAGLQHAIFAIANLFIQAGINSFDASVVSGNSAASNVDSIIYNVVNAFYMAAASFVGQNYGAGNKKRVRQSFWISVAFAFGTALVLGIVAALFGRSFLRIFSEYDAVIDAGMYRVVILGLSYCISVFMDLPIAASRGLGKTLVPTVCVILGSCVFRVIWLYTVFAWFGTLTSLYMLYVFSWALTSLAETLYFIHCYRHASFEHAATDAVLEGAAT